MGCCVRQGGFGVWRRLGALSQIVAVIAVLLAASLVLALYVAPLLPTAVRLPATTIATLAAVASGLLFLQRDGLSYRDLGLRRPARWRAVVLWATAGFLVAELGAMGLGLVFTRVFGWPAPNVEYIRAVIVGEPVAYVAWIAAAWICAAFGEELTARGFFMDRLGRVFGKGRAGLVAAAIGQAMIFGLLHAPQGPAGVVVTAWAGLVLAWVYHASGRNFWASILAHAAMDTLSLTLLFLGYWPAAGSR